MIFPEFDEEEYNFESDEEEEQQNIGEIVKNQTTIEKNQLMKGNTSLVAKSQKIRQFPILSTLWSEIRMLFLF